MADYKPADPAYEAKRDKAIADAIRRRRAARGASSAPPAAPPAASAPGIIDRIKAAMMSSRDSSGRPVGRQGQARADAIDAAAEKAATGRQRRGQSTDHQNGY